MKASEEKDIDINALPERLGRARDDILLALESLDQAGMPVELDQQAQGRLSRMDAINQQQMARAGRSRLGLELARVDAALRRHAEGRYGVCCRCGQSVAPARLAADPATPLCLDCASAAEDGSR